jgi:hypothetical protein
MVAKRVKRIKLLVRARLTRHISKGIWASQEVAGWELYVYWNIMQDLFNNLFGLIGLVLYFIPSIVAIRKRSYLIVPILFINFFFGWTIIGWIVAFVLALKQFENREAREATFFKNIVEQHRNGVNFPLPLPATQISSTTIQKESKPLPYQKKDYLLSIAERKFFDVLYPIAQEHGWYVFPKVRLEDFFMLPGGMFKNERWSWRGRIKSRHVDFLLCDKTNIRPIAAVELDDASHNLASRIIRDDFYEELFKDAGLPLVRFKVKAFYNPQEVMDRIVTLQR